MSAGVVHFIGIVGSALAALLLVLARFGKPTLWRALGAGVSLMVPAFGASAGLHRCDAGAPLSQWLVPGLAVFLVVLFVEPRPLRFAAAGSFTLLCVGLSFHYAEAVHGSSWIGNPDSFTLEGERAEVRWHTPVTGLYGRVADPSRRRLPADAAP
ncbi:MAG: hypothetical protein IPI67_30810 [Myxococcales bacterium]|nr:hypothetical protein [Myxococcales bacterium]